MLELGPGCFDLNSSCAPKYQYPRKDNYPNIIPAFIGASLSEPHTSVTALQVACTCMSSTYIREAIYRKLKLNERIYGGARPFQICTHAKALMFRMKLTQWTPRYLTGSTECMRTMTDKDRLFTDDIVKSLTVVEFTSGKGHA